MKYFFAVLSILSFILSVLAMQSGMSINQEFPELEAIAVARMHYGYTLLFVSLVMCFFGYVCWQINKITNALEKKESPVHCSTPFRHDKCPSWRRNLPPRCAGSIKHAPPVNETVEAFRR